LVLLIFLKKNIIYYITYYIQILKFRDILILYLNFKENMITVIFLYHVFILLQIKISLNLSLILIIVYNDNSLLNYINQVSLKKYLLNNFNVPFFIFLVFIFLENLLNNGKRFLFLRRLNFYYFSIFFEFWITLLNRNYL